MARDCLYCFHIYPATAWESMSALSACHALCSFTPKLHGCSLSFLLYQLLIVNRAFAPFTITLGAKSPCATLVCARPLSHRLRYGCLLSHAHAYVPCHTNSLHCAPVPLSFLTVAPSGGTRTPFAYFVSLFPFFGEPHSVCNEGLQPLFLYTAEGSFTYLSYLIVSIQTHFALK